MKPIIEVRGISKRYKLGQIQGYKTIRESFSNLFHPHNSLSPKGGSTPQKFLSPKGRGKGEGAESRDFIWALKDVSFDVQPGEVIGIIGRNGSGKSTLLKILTRITEPTEGTARLRGQVASLLEVGTGFHPELTGRENVYLNGAILGMRKADIDKKFDEIIAFAEVERFVDTPVKRYSSGMYVRLAFAVAAHLEPEILLVDEVLAVGDFEFQKKCLGKMGAVAKEGRTILFVSHNMDAIKTLCTNGILLNNGKITSHSNINEVVNIYLSNFEKTGVQKLEWHSKNKEYPHEDYIKIISYRILDNNNAVADNNFVTSKKYKAVIEIELKQPYSEIKIGYAIYTQDERMILTSVINDDGVLHLGKFTPGCYTFEAPIPIELFSNGNYKIELLCVLERFGWILPGANETRFKFSLFRDNDPSPFAIHRFGGVESPLSPILKWKLRD